jgi:hypothetical protein
MKGKLVVDSLSKFKQDVQIFGDLKVKSLEDTVLNYNRLVGINANGKIITYPNIEVSGNSITSRRLYTRRITTLPGDSLIHLGDSSLVFDTYYNRIYGDCFINKYGTNICGTAIGRAALATGTNSIAIGNFVSTIASNNIIIGKGINGNNVLTNNIPFSLMIGFNSTIPTLFIGPAGGNGQTGLVGIGTSTPHCEFHIKGHNGNADMCIESQNGTQWDWASSDNGSLSAFSPSFNITPLSIASSGQVNLNQSSNSDYALFVQNNGGDGNCLRIKGGSGNGASGNYSLLLAETNAGAEVFKINGKTGTTWARKITVTQSSFADYVFESNYSMLKLADLEQYVLKNKHLPNIPSETEIKERGMDLGEMQKLQMEKIEELTLYVIQQQKEIEALKEVIKHKK